MAIARFQGEAVFVDGIDFKRAARRFRDLLIGPDGQPAKDLGQALDELARVLGFESHHALRAAARRDDAAQPEEPLFQLEREARITGAPFPKVLPERFDVAWRNTAVALFKQALLERAADRAEIVAVVGHTGSGKTMLVRHMVHLFGGEICDVTLSSRIIAAERMAQGALIVYDRPASLPVRPPFGASSMRLPLDPDQLRIDKRSRFDPTGPFGFFAQMYQQLLADTSRNIVVALPSDDAVHELLTSILHPGVGHPGSFGFKAAQVVNLDTMKFYTTRALSTR